ncbi:hypothetical protein SDC9_197566 [bioreactor metagenome]|uniref:Uncharacterized protein n=1 Tax=bioreactor metagenome TaxID=1076179 RepID=A0A645IGH0_9ZZZZ
MGLLEFQQPARKETFDCRLLSTGNGQPDKTGKIKSFGHPQQYFVPEFAQRDKDYRPAIEQSHEITKKTGKNEKQIIGEYEVTTIRVFYTLQCTNG